jgi:hypothetical protein
VTRLRIVGTLAALVLVGLFAFVFQQGFTVFEYRQIDGDALLPVDGETGDAVSRALWGDRQGDVIVLALLLLVTGVGCAGILRPEQEDAAWYR